MLVIFQAAPLRAFVFIFLVIFVFHSGVFAEARATELVERFNQLYRGTSSHSFMTMKIRTPRWRRTLEIETWNLKNSRALLRIHKPIKEGGNGTLRVDKNIWNWLPAVERVIEVPSNMMHASWMGSDFSYDDMVKTDSIVKDYSHKISSEKFENEKTTYIVEIVPKPKASGVWGKIWLTLSESDGVLLPIKEEDYAEEGDLIRTLKFSQVMEMGGQQMPTRIECLPAKRPKQKTILLYRGFERDDSIHKGLFELSNLMKPLQVQPPDDLAEGE